MGKAQDASKTSETISDGWAALGTFTRTAPTYPNYKALRLASATHDEWMRHTLMRHKLPP